MKKVLLAVLLASATLLPAQTGFPRFASIQNGGMDNINLYNLNVEFRIPILSIMGRGFPFNPGLTYNSTFFQKNGTVWSPSPLLNYGWQRDAPVGNATFSYQKLGCYVDWASNPHQWKYRYYNFQYVEPDGTKHSFNLDFVLAESPGQYPECSDPSPIQTGFATDGSGYYVEAYGLGGPSPLNAIHPKAYAPTGAAVVNSSTSSDTNGNSITSSVISGTETDWVDSSGRLALKVINNTSSNPDSTQYQYRDTTGAWNPITLSMTAKNIWTNFNCSGVSEYSATSIKIPTNVALPNGTNYVIEYEANALHSGYVTGRISKITLPTGGYIQYAYSGTDCNDGSTLTLTRTTSDGNTSATTTYIRSQNQTRVIDPQLPYDSVANETRYTFDSSGIATMIEIFQGSSASGTLLRKVENAWSPAHDAITVTTTVGSKQSKTTSAFDMYGNLSSTTEFDWGGATPLRSTAYTYNTSQAYQDARILNRPTRVEIHAGATTDVLQSATDYVYDESGHITSCPASVPQHNDGLYGCSSTTPRGNLTTMKHYVDVSGTGANPVITSFNYDSLGNLLTTTVDGALQTTTTYSTATNYSQPNSIAVGPGPTGQSVTNFTYDNSYTGLLTSTTDPNGLQTTFTYDSMLRAKNVTRPSVAGGNVTTTVNYDDVAKTITVISPLDPGRTLTQISWMDGLSRVFKVQTPTGTTQTIFDPIGRVYRKSNPFANGGTATYWTESRYDAVGRPTAIITPDGITSAGYSYTENATTITDGAGKQSKQEFDGLGRLTKVYEPDVSAGNTLTQTTSYGYSALDSLVMITQGSQTRSFSYDGLNRMTAVTTPEAGTVQYAYKNGSFLCSTAPSNICSRKDARNVITNYSYDSLNRMQGVTYDVSLTGNTVPATPGVGYTYGTTAGTPSFGRLLTMTDGTGSETYTYDPLGNVSSVAKLVTGTPGQTYTTQYAYNDAGMLTKLTYPSGMVIKEGYDSSGRFNALTEGDPTTVKTYMNNFSFDDAGNVVGYTMGASSPISATLGYSQQRLQLGSLTYSQAGSTILGLSYGYQQNGGNNGQITSTNDLLQPGRNATYSYDSLNRLTGFGTTGTFTEGGINYNAISMSWTYDRYGNRLTQNGPGGVQTLNPSALNNQLSGYTYDPSGNVTSDGPYGIVWDAEGRMVQYAANVSYAYDGNSLRLKKTNGATTIFIRAGVMTLAEYAPGAPPTSPLREYVYGGGQLIASKASGSYKWYVRDHLSVRATYDEATSGLLRLGHLPFGEDWYGASTEKWRFTGYEREADINQDYATFRQYVFSQGRYVSPDTVPGRVEDPQSWNRYTYVLNDPLGLNDLLGLMPECFALVTFYDDGQGNITLQSVDMVMCFGGWNWRNLAYFDIPPMSTTDQPDKPNQSHKPNEACKKALAEAHKNLGAVQRAYDNWSNIEEASRRTGIDPSIIAAVGVRETGYQNVNENGSNGNQGVGPYQIDQRYYPYTTHVAGDPRAGTELAAAIVMSSVSRNFRYGTTYAMATGLMEYNAGTGHKSAVFDGLSGLDSVTKLGNYVSNVIGLAQCFQ